RKLKAVCAVLEDASASANERANAEALKERLERQLRTAGVPEGDWSDTVFRLGRMVRVIGQGASRPARQGDWTDHAFRIGRMLRRGLKTMKAKD
ncbi:MAG TPA: hypothetical protein VL993_01975, partial [Stellaceae bacterium]|nr:hypothetical protein [Stellaceae bacterium]